MSKKDYDETVKILMLGESGVGKSSLLTRFSDDKFMTNFITTLGVEYKFRIETINSKKTLIQIWDTAGQEQFRTITPVYYRKVDGVVMVYDITDQNSFESVNYWMKNLSDYADQNIKIILVGNKQDMQDKRIVAKEEGEKIATKFKIKFMEASAKNKTNVNEIFMGLAKDILDNKKPEDNKIAESIILTGRESKKANNAVSKKSCC